MTILTAELIDLVEQSEIEVLEDRLTRVMAQNNNAMGVELRKFGKAVAFSVKNIPGPSFNTVKGLSGENLNDINAIVDFYTSKGIPTRFEVTPANASKKLFQTLSKNGFYQSGFHTSLYCNLPTAVPEVQTKIEIAELSAENFAIFGEMYTKGFGMPHSLSEYVTANNQILAESSHWTFYLASVAGEPAGVGVLFIKDGIATLAASATVPTLRNKGVQTALIQKRIQQAMEAGCHLVVGQAAFASVSQKNMERAGLRVAYTNGVWEKL